MTRCRGGRRIRAWWAGLYSLERSRGRHRRCRKNITKFLDCRERVRGQCPFQKAGLEWPWTMCDCGTVVVQLREGRRWVEDLISCHMHGGLTAFVASGIKCGW